MSVRHPGGGLSLSWDAPWSRFCSVLFSVFIDGLAQGGQTFSVRSQTGNSFGFVVHRSVLHVFSSDCAAP